MLVLNIAISFIRTGCLFLLSPLSLFLLDNVFHLFHATHVSEAPGYVSNSSDSINALKSRLNVLRVLALLVRMSLVLASPGHKEILTPALVKRDELMRTEIAPLERDS